MRGYSSDYREDSVGMVSVTSSVRLDVTLILAFLIFLITTSCFLRVYYRVTVTDIRIVYTFPEGTTRYLPTPSGFMKNGLAVSSTERLLADFEGRINQYMQSSGWYLNYLYKQPGARIYWSINYSYNSTDLDRKKIIRFDETSKL